MVPTRAIIVRGSLYVLVLMANVLHADTGYSTYTLSSSSGASSDSTSGPPSTSGGPPDSSGSSVNSTIAVGHFLR